MIVGATQTSVFPYTLPDYLFFFLMALTASFCFILKLLLVFVQGLH